MSDPQEPLDDMPESTETAAQPEPQAQPAPDFDAIHDATDAHNAAVSAAHQTLAQRLRDAYQIFGEDLTRAYKVWENIVSSAKLGSGIAHDVSEVVSDVQSDPTTVR